MKRFIFRYYLLSHNIRPGARRINSLCMTKKVIAFENTDGQIVVFIANLNNKEEEGTLNFKNKQKQFKLPPLSINVLTLK